MSRNPYHRFQLQRHPTEPPGWNGSPAPSNESSWPHLRPRIYSKYERVEVLLLQWDADDLGVDTEIIELEILLRSHFNFTTHVRRIPDEYADEYIARTILEFRKGTGHNDLLIVYYGGHAAGSTGDCTLIANRKPSSPSLNWLAVQGLLLEHDADVLLIFDCCYATQAARGTKKGDNWFLGASARESLASGASWRSFTSAMIRELRRRAQLHKDDGTPFTIQAIHGSLILFDRDLSVTPVITRLTDRECDATDLTPLREPFTPSLQTSPSAPLYPLSISHPFAQRTRPPVMNPSAPGRTHARSLPVIHSVMDVSPDTGFLSVRLRSLPASSTPEDIRKWIADRLPHARVSRIGPLTTSQPPSTIITFSTTAATKEALQIHDRYFCTQSSQEEATVKLDDDFFGLTCLYSSIKSPEKNPTVDLVLVHGTDGHAINTFASYLTDPIREALWPCAELPEVLEQAGIYPRIMTFGWDANVWLEPNKNHQQLDEASGTLRRELNQERSNCKNRPLIFIAHGVGGLLVKQAIRDTINFAFDEQYTENPIKACFFFAVPHHQSIDALGFESILRAMDAVMPHRNVPDFAATGSLHSQSQSIDALSKEFDLVRKEYGIHVQCFYEKQTTGNTCVVPEDFAVLDTGPTTSHPVEAIFRDIVRLNKSEQNLRQVLDVMRDAIQQKLNPPPAPKPTPKKENVYPRLQSYDIVFLVDDSDSMAGYRWAITSTVLARITEIAVIYDKDGVDIRFFNAYLEDEKRLGLNSSEKVMKLFNEITPSGPTPTADKLEEELGLYLNKLREKQTGKRLNLIVLTDGEPDEEAQAVEEVIVKYANELKKLRAHPLQVGVQFVQIGGDEDATKFLRSLDDDLVTKRGLDRDVGFFSLLTWF